MAERVRVAVYGGDERVARLEWPSYLDVRHYGYKSPGEQRRLQDSLSAGRIRHLILLTNYMGHSAEATLRASAEGVNVIRWPRSPMQLLREINDIIPAPRSVNPLYGPPGTPAPEPWRGPIDPEEEEPEDSPPVPLPPPVMNENEPGATSVADAVTRLLQREGMTQKSFAQLMGVAQATVSSWTRGASLPTGDRLARLVELIPELMDLGPPVPGRNETVTVQVTRHVEDDELLSAHREWREARENLRAATERLRIAEERLEEVRR